MKVWVVLGEEGEEGGYRYVSAVFDSEEKAAAYVANGWGLDAVECEVE